MGSSNQRKQVRGAMCKTISIYLLSFRLWLHLVPPSCLNANIASSLAMYTFLAISIDKSDKDDSVEFYVSSFVNLLPVVCGTINTATEGTFQVYNSALVVDRFGVVSGFCDCLAQVHTSVKALLVRDPWLGSS